MRQRSIHQSFSTASSRSCWRIELSWRFSIRHCWISDPLRLNHTRAEVEGYGVRGRMVFYAQARQCRLIIEHVTLWSSLLLAFYLYRFHLATRLHEDIVGCWLLIGWGRVAKAVLEKFRAHLVSTAQPKIFVFRVIKRLSWCVLRANIPRLFKLLKRVTKHFIILSHG